MIIDKCLSNNNESKSLEAKSLHIGVSKIFMKEEIRLIFEQELQRAIKEAIIHIQKHFRGKKARKLF